MSKYDILSTVAEKIQAIDNEVKLKILALLVEEGSKSITDISKDLSINFSTAHKYLEQLEAAELVASKQISENRMKRMFTIKDFNIDVSPKGISEMLNRKTTTETKSGLKVINEKGELTNFDEKIFSQKYLKRGMPRGTIASTISSILENAYNGITLLELRRMFSRELDSKVSAIKSVFSQIADDEKYKRTHAHTLSIVHPEALDMHANGSIFIRNLRNPKLLSFILSFPLIANHGVTGKKPHDLNELLAQTLIAIDKARDFSSEHFGLDLFSYLLSKFIAGKEHYIDAIEKFFEKVENAGINLYIGLDVGAQSQKFLNAFDHALAEQVAAQILDLLKRKKFLHIHPIIKAWSREQIKKDYSDLPEFYLANMTSEWQTENASFANSSRFDASWRGTLRTDRVGEAQEIVINLPRIAAHSKSRDEFLRALGTITRQASAFQTTAMELTVGEFLRKYGIHVPSEHAGSWTFVSIPDASYSVSVAGLPNAIKSITNNDMASEIKFAKKALNVMAENLVAPDNTPIRLTLKECSDTNIMQRFYNLDKKQGIKNSEYFVGACDCFDSCELHSCLPGGHTLRLNKKIYKTSLSTLSKKNFGMLLVK